MLERIPRLSSLEERSITQDNPDLFEPSLIGGTFLGVTSALPLLMYLNGVCCALIIGGGILASYFYIRAYPSHMTPVTLGDGALVGLLSGGVGSVVYAMVTIPLEFVKSRLGFGLQELAQLEETLVDPKIPEAVRQMVRALFEGGTFSIGILFIELLFFMITALIFATIGGVIGVALFQKNSPEELTRIG